MSLQPADLIAELVQTPWNIITSPRRAAETIAWYLPTVAAFGAFVIWNGGIVLGTPHRLSLVTMIVC